jgi:pyruvate formate-lyase/glycerol dehydratase family glycyl radical enzyme
MVELDSRNQQQKDALLHADHWLCMERAKWYTDTYKANEGEHPSLVAAKALRETLKHMTIDISPVELLVGNRSSQLIAPPFAPEKGDFTFLFKYRLPELKKFGYNISKEDEDLLFKEIIPYWEGKTVREQKVKQFIENGLNSEINFKDRLKFKAFGLPAILNLLLARNEGTSTWKRIGQIIELLFHLPRNLKAMKAGTQDNIIGRGRCIDTQAHIVVGHKNVLQLGFKGIYGQASDRIASASNDGEKSFLEGVMIVAQAMRDFSLRFSSLAREKANQNGLDAIRSQELLMIAEICENVPWNPPSSFHDALQAMWFTQNAIIISYGAGSGITPGRVDQLLYPFYQADISRGNITRDDALHLIEEFVIKINNNVVIWPNIAGTNLNHLGSDIENITIGGVNRDGNDATNELSYLFIEAIKNTKLATTASFRFSSKSPGQFVQDVLDLHRYTNGPALFNDDISVKMMENDGYAIEDARDYCLVGCVEPSGNGDTFGATGGTKIYLPTVLDLVINRGKTSFFGNVDTADTGDPEKFATFVEFMNAYYAQMQHIVTAATKATCLRDTIWATRFHNPLISCTIDGCIENAKDMTTGGASYNFNSLGAGGLATTVDSLAAIKKFVFDDRSITMKALVHALQTNFKGNEELRLKLTHGPKFGNDDDLIDSIAVDIVNKFCAMCKKERTINGGHFKASFISYGLNVYEGALEPATPDGRKATAPVSNSMSPSNGAEMHGPTAVFNSLAKIDQTAIGYGNSLNMKFPRYLLDEKGLDRMRNLVLVYFKKGGFHVQFNVIDAAMLKDAQAHPGNYEDLIVRVSGYSAYFTRLGKTIQDDLINRVEFTCL